MATPTEDLPLNAPQPRRYQLLVPPDRPSSPDIPLSIALSDRVTSDGTVKPKSYFQYNTSFGAATSQPRCKYEYIMVSVGEN